jgi:hypothetical protein
MNPPFTRHGAHEGDRTDVHNPAFAAFEADEEEQNRLAAQLHHLAAGGCAHGHAGLASYFVDLAHRKLAENGTVALVLPLSSMSGASWERVRALWRDQYSAVVVVTIAQSGTHTRSFSADTGMAECLLVAKKNPPGDGAQRAVFVVLRNRPDSTLEGDLVAHVVCDLIERGDVVRLEDGPFGGTRITLGETQVGEIIDCPLPLDGAWQFVGILDISLGQTAYQLACGQLWIEGMPEGDALGIPIARIGDVSLRMGPHHLDIAGAQVKADGLPQGPFERIEGLPPGTAYPCLWSHDKSRERQLVVAPDSHCRIRRVNGRVPAALQERANTRWETATRAHYSLDLRFNSQSLVVATTAEPSIGGRAWPSVVFEDRTQEVAFALWCNSSLGILCHWWMSNKTQDGRGTTTVTTVPVVPTLDLRALTAAQHRAAQQAFEALAGERFLPFDQIDEDDARAELDRRLLVDVLGLDPRLCVPGGPMERLRRKLANEPQIHSNKQTRLVFTEDGETSVRRDVQG